MATCTHETPFTDFDGSRGSFSCTETATWLAWFPQQDGYDPATGTVVPVCGDHLIGLTVEIPDAELVAISDLPMTCSGCGEPVWALHPEDHTIGRAHGAETGAGSAATRLRTTPLAPAPR